MAAVGSAPDNAPSVPKSTLDALQQRLASLSINTSSLLSHALAPAPDAWKAALLNAASSAPPNSSSSSSSSGAYTVTKTLLYKPKTAKTAKPYPVLAFVADDSDMSLSLLGKKIGQKDMRLASPELIEQFLGVAKDDVSPLSVTPANAPEASHPLLVVIDAKLKADPAARLALRANSAEKTLLLASQDVLKYLESTKVKIETVDFAQLKAEGGGSAAPAAAATSGAAKGGGAGANASASATSGTAAAAAAAADKSAARIADAELIGITVRKDLDFPDWYQQVLRKGDMLDYYDVSGCYILKPWSYHVWQTIQTFFDSEIKKLGVENCYFPMFVSSDVLEREKDHIEGFAPEVAWVTRAGSSDLERPVAIRPTSETVMYPYYAKWIHSHRDLPLKLNQWNSVVRWEFKHPQPFLRTREFLWQEGHTAHMTLEEADKEVYQILDLYRRVYEELLAVPVVPGIKSEKEKFAGGYYTTTVEGFVPTTGRGIQGGTSHCLGQNFSKMFNISVEDPNASEAARGKAEGRLFVWQNSWGLSTRTIGVMVMVHGDDKGLVMPPRVSQVQAAIVPCGLTVRQTTEERNRVLDACAQLERELRAAGIRAKADLRDNYNPGYKFNDWELRGVPVRLEVGPKDLEKKQVTWVRRLDGQRGTMPSSSVAQDLSKLLDRIHDDMLARADAEYRRRRKVVEKWEDFTRVLNEKNHVIIPWCEVMACEDAIKERSARTATEGEAQDERAPSMGAKTLCIPLDQAQYGPIQGKVCPQCGKPAKRWTMLGRSY